MYANSQIYKIKRYQSQVSESYRQIMQAKSIRHKDVGIAELYKTNGLNYAVAVTTVKKHAAS